MDSYTETRENRYSEDLAKYDLALTVGTAVIAVYENADKTEGRGPMTLVGLFSSAFAAAQARRGKGIMGVASRDIMDTEAKVLPVHASFEDYVDNLPAGHPDKRLALANNPDYQHYLTLKERFGE